MKKYRLASQILVGILLVSFCGCGLWLARGIIGVNEPDPSTIDVSQLNRRFAANGILLRVDALYYVNLDYNGYIFTGSATVELETKDWIAQEEEYFALSGRKYSDLFPIRSGVLYMKKLDDGRTLYGFVRSTKHEWSQAEEWFKEKWIEAIEDLQS